MKNTHLEHPEDTILTGDLDVLGWFQSAGRLSVKIDGAPAIVWGRCPVTGRQFVGTKSVFCLLYTSPSPRDVEESRMPSSA